MRTKVVNKNQEAYDVYIGRGSIFGNPYEIGRDGTREQVIARYKEWFNFLTRDVGFVDEVLRLEGKRLGCFCVPEPCHGEVIVEWLRWFKREGAAKKDPETIKQQEDAAAEDCFTSGNCDDNEAKAQAENDFHDKHGTCSCHAGEVEAAQAEESERALVMQQEAEVVPDAKLPYDPSDTL